MKNGRLLHSVQSVKYSLFTRNLLDTYRCILSLLLFGIHDDHFLLRKTRESFHAMRDVQTCGTTLPTPHMMHRISLWGDPCHGSLALQSNASMPYPAKCIPPSQAPFRTPKTRLPTVVRVSPMSRKHLNGRRSPSYLLGQVVFTNCKPTTL